MKIQGQIRIIISIIGIDVSNSKIISMSIGVFYNGNAKNTDK